MYLPFWPPCQLHIQCLIRCLHLNTSWALQMCPHQDPWFPPPALSYLPWSSFFLVSVNRHHLPKCSSPKPRNQPRSFSLPHPSLTTPISKSWLCTLLSPQMNPLPLEHTGGFRSACASGLPVVTLPCLNPVLNSGGRSLIFLRRQRCPVTSSLKTFQRPPYAHLTGSLGCIPETYKTL